MADAATQARGLIRIVRGDPGLPARVRRRAGRLAALIADNPDLALERLNELRVATIPDLLTTSPTTDYARFLSVESFWRFNLDPYIKADFVSPEYYRRFIETDPNPETRLASHLGPDQIVPAEHSWLVPAHRVAGLSSTQAKSLLNFDQLPPYVVMVFSVDKMKAVGMKVRRPRGIDAVPSRLIQWHPDNVPGERIDLDIPRFALESIEWRP